MDGIIKTFERIPDIIVNVCLAIFSMPKDGKYMLIYIIGGTLLGLGIIVWYLNG